MANWRGAQIKLCDQPKCALTRPAGWLAGHKKGQQCALIELNSIFAQECTSKKCSHFVATSLLLAGRSVGRPAGQLAPSVVRAAPARSLRFVPRAATLWSRRSSSSSGAPQPPPPPPPPPQQHSLAAPSPKCALERGRATGAPCLRRLNCHHSAGLSRAFTFSA